MPMKIDFNPAQLQANIMNAAERASRSASGSMRKTAIRIRDLAREYAPRDTGTLERAIDYGTVIGANRRNVFVVYIDIDALHPDGKSVGDYAWIMEEQLHRFGRKAGKLNFTLGPGSIAKGGKVGGKFLARAIKEGSKEMLPDAILAVKRSLGSLINMNYQRNTGGQE